MSHSREVGAVLEGRAEERFLDRVLEAAALATSSERVHDVVAKLVEIAALDPIGTLECLRALQVGAEVLQGLERELDLSPDRATLALGGAIQLASAELASDDPDLGSRTEELERWLEGSW